MSRLRSLATGLLIGAILAWSHPAAAQSSLAAGAIRLADDVIASTRTQLRIDEQADQAEVLRRDRIEHTLLMSPDRIVRSLDDMASLRALNTSPELGLETVRIHGQRGQYTRLLADGIPLYFDHPGGLAPVQISPMDLDRVEVIGGAASALFGANATGGVVNLLSRRPGDGWSREFLFNQTSARGTDGVMYLASPATGSWSGTTLVGIHYQDERDGDDDGWSDIAGYRRGAARQRVYWTNGQGRSVSGVAGVTFEKREGGSAFARQQLETKIADGGLFGEMPLGSFVLAGAGSLYVQSRVREFSDVTEHDRRQGATLEITLRKSAPRNTWVTGIAADWFAVRTPTAPLLSASVAPRGGLFVHDDLQVTPWFRVSGTARVDYTKGAGEVSRVDRFFFSPRGSALVHNGGWSAGLTAGQGYFVPTALTPETEAAGVSRLTIEGPLEIEETRSVSGNVAYRNSAAALSLTLFHSRVEDPATLDRATYTLRTGSEPLVTRALEILGTARRAPFAVSGTYAFIQARESDDVDVARTPRHSARVSAWAESAGRGRIGIRGSFTGEQRLDANPYRTTSESYFLVGLFGEHQFGRWRVFVNADNLSDVRQTDWDPIARPARDVDGRWTVDAWAPLAGRVINAGIRISY